MTVQGNRIINNIYLSHIQIVSNRKIMHLNNTYSLKALLQSDLDPQLCKLMLHQIKSPLLEHSFQLTTDDQYNSGSFSIPNQGYYPNQRPYICEHKQRKLQNERQRNQNKNNKRLESMSMVHSQYQLSKREHKNQRYHRNQQIASNKKEAKYNCQNYNSNTKSNINNSPGPLQQQYKQTAQNKQFVSPFECNQQINSTLSNLYPQRTIQNGFILEETDLQIKQKGQIAKWCGQIFNFDDAYQNQIYFEPSNYVRKKIFKKNVNRNTIRSDSTNTHLVQYVSFQQAINRLNLISQEKMAKFIQFLSRVLSLLKKIEPHRNQLIENESKVNKIILQYSPVDIQLRQTIPNKNRIVNRLKVNKISQVFYKIVSLNKDHYSYPIHVMEGTKMQSQLSKTLQYYSQIEQIVENYVSRRQAVTDLHQIYNLLYSYQIGLVSNQNYNQAPSPVSSARSAIQGIKNNQQNQRKISDNYYRNVIGSYSLRDKIQRLLSGLKIHPQQYSNLSQLNYIWNQINVKGAYSPFSQTSFKTNKEKFIAELCRNDILIHQRTQGIVQLDIEKKLTQMGFKRNIQ